MEDKTLQRMSMFGTGTIIVPKDDAGAIRQLSDLLAKIIQVVADFDAGVASIRGSNEFSDIGEAAHIGTTALSYKAKLDEVLGFVDKSRALLEGLREQTRVDQDEDDSAAAAILASEIRQYLMKDGVDQLSIEATLLHAIGLGDSATVRAILDAPQVFGLVGDETRARAEHEWNLKKSPALAREIAVFADALKQVDSAMLAAESHIDKVARILPEPIEV